MKSKLLFYVLVFPLLISITGCVVYHPMTTDIPLINKKKDLRLDAGISVIESGNATISYGLTNKIAIQGFANVGTHDRYYFQAAAGLFKNIGNNKVFELYSGFGYGYGNAYSDVSNGNLLGDYRLYFAQANYGKIASKSSNLELGIGLKIGYMRSNLTNKNYYRRAPDPEPIKTYHDKSILLEPTAFLRIGNGNLKFTIKLGKSNIYKLTNKDKHFPFAGLNLGIGLNYRL